MSVFSEVAGVTQLCDFEAKTRQRAPLIFIIAFYAKSGSDFEPSAFNFFSAEKEISTGDLFARHLWAS